MQAQMGVKKIPDARYQALLNSNEPPIESEYPFIQSVLLRQRSYLAQHDDAVREPEGQTQEHQSLVETVARHAAILSPLRRMPSEILCEFFSSTLLPDWQLLDRGRIDLQDSPWSLSHTCSRWREIALGLPSL
ncbi:hypothetical protein B0H16DRAFT_1416340 [Mycena metata]|uniref:F-box domain-containing protein n=1 Tax=Mycena metata TaxID=1033252 RepID=A0AAD7JAV5_9AGAR|nr:hypothetical protein B0H16DRAFT_1416340 [Mycena metata]